LSSEVADGFEEMEMEEEEGLMLNLTPRSSLLLLLKTTIPFFFSRRVGNKIEEEVTLEEVEEELVGSKEGEEELVEEVEEVEAAWTWGLETDECALLRRSNAGDFCTGGKGGIMAERRARVRADSVRGEGWVRA
jgi:hypothetical protein